MSDIAIRVENPCPERRRRMSKRYQIGARQKRHDTLRDQIADWDRCGKHVLSILSAVKGCLG